MSGDQMQLTPKPTSFANNFVAELGADAVNGIGDLDAFLAIRVG